MTRRPSFRDGILEPPCRGSLQEDRVQDAVLAGPRGHARPAHFRFQYGSPCYDVALDIVRVGRVLEDREYLRLGHLPRLRVEQIDELARQHPYLHMGASRADLLGLGLPDGREL